MEEDPNRAFPLYPAKWDLDIKESGPSAQLKYSKVKVRGDALASAVDSSATMSQPYLPL